VTQHVVPIGTQKTKTTMISALEASNNTKNSVVLLYLPLNCSGFLRTKSFAPLLLACLSPRAADYQQAKTIASISPVSLTLLLRSASAPGDTRK
jgi:hypothetical protein